MVDASGPRSIPRSARQGTSFLAVLLLMLVGTAWAADGPQYWRVEFPDTDFARHDVPYAEIRSDGARRDTIPAIVNPTFIPARKARGLGATEPVLSVQVGNEARAYPLRLLLWHEIVNDRVGATRLVVAYSPLTNTAAVYEREIEGEDRALRLSFGNTGRLRHFGVLLYDRETGSWWQQYDGRAVVGRMTGRRLRSLSARIEAWGLFRQRRPNGRVLVPNDPTARPYGTTPFVRMDTSPGAGLDAYPLPSGVEPFDRVVAVGDEAWTLKTLSARGAIETDSLHLSWTPGQNSAHDTKAIAFGRDVGNVVVKRFERDAGGWVDAVHSVGFAFAFKAHVWDGRLRYDPPADGN